MRDNVRRAIALAAPVAIPVAMAGAFRIARERLGDRRGYVAGFASYWATCAAFSATILGPRGLVRALTGPAPPPTDDPIKMALLIWPPAGAIATRFVPGLRGATRETLATAAVVAQVNSTLEELAWRACYSELWPDNAFLGFVWPAIGFAAWHLAPQVIHPSKMGSSGYVGASLAIGLSWGWVAWRTRSIRWTTLSHAVTDGSGLENARYFIAA